MRPRMKLLRIVFMGTAELARPSLAALAQSPFCHLIAVITQPDRPKGRELKLQSSPVKIEALRWNLPVFQPEKARSESFLRELAELSPDLIVVAAYGQLLPRTILEIPEFGCLNVHTSLLPKYRGAAPIQWAILHDEAETGVTIMKMDTGLDTGDILTQQRTPIEPADNSQVLHDRLAAMGATLLLKTIPEYVAGKIVPQKQPETGAVYARKITKEDGLINWALPARTIWNQIRAFTPWPGAFTYLPTTTQRLLKIWEATVAGDVQGPPGELLHLGPRGIVVGCGVHALRILCLQREGGRRLTSGEFLAGHKLAAGQKLG
jgi:methionyl-tRNA formyltransferase